MTARNVLNIGLALALTGLMTLIIYDPGKEIPAPRIALTALEPADIQKLVIEHTRQGITAESLVLKKTVLTKTKDQWIMISPYNNLANTLLINKFLALASAKSHAQYPVANINSKQLNLLTPDLIITLNKTKLFFGTTDAIKGLRYIQIKNTVHLITDYFSFMVRGQASTLLSPALLPKNTIIKKLVLPELTLQTGDTGWNIIPENKSIGTDQLQQLIDEWRFARALRVSKITADTNNKTISVEVYNDKNERIVFGLTQTEDEIILSRSDIGLHYYFTTETGEKLFQLQPDTNDASVPN